MVLINLLKRDSEVCKVLKSRKRNRLRREKFPNEDKEYKKTWRVNNRDKINSYWLQSIYGVSKAEYDEMFIAQSGLCAICRKPPSDKKPLVVDHDHSDGFVRGLLCKKCNFGIGHFEDSEGVLTAAIEYINKAKESKVLSPSRAISAVKYFPGRHI